MGLYLAYFPEVQLSAPNTTMTSVMSKPKYPEFVAVKMSVALRRAVERAAAAEDRSVGSFIRRALEAVVSQ